MASKWEIIEWTFMGKIWIDSIYFQTCNYSQSALLSSLLFKIQDNNYTHFLTFMVTLIRKVASCLGTPLITPVYKQKVSYLPNISPQFANLFNSRHVILAKNKCHPKTREKISPRKDVQELSFINGLILLTVTLYKLDCLKM